MNDVPRIDSDPDMQEEYDFSQGIQGKYAQRYAEGTNIIVLAPDVAAVFHDSEAVNTALRGLIAIARQSINNATAAVGASPTERGA